MTEPETTAPDDDVVRCWNCRHPLVWVVTDLPDGAAIGRFDRCRYCREDKRREDMA